MLWVCGFCARADLYTGSLTSADGGIKGTGLWVDPSVAGNPGDYVPMVFSWIVSKNPDGNSWHYHYEIQVYRGELSHWELETSDIFTGRPPDLQNPTGDFGELETKAFDPGNGNPNMPDGLYGIKFDEVSDYGTESGPDGKTLTYTADFDSWRVPVWQDFYAKGGQIGGTQIAAWNAGFTDPDTNPPESAPLQNGSLDYHILAPDSIIPEPSTFTLLILGLGALLARRAPRRPA